MFSIALFWATKFFLIIHLVEKNYSLKNQISMMKKLLALVSILKLKRMKAKPLKRHCIFPKRQKFVSSSLKGARWAFKKDNDNGIQLFLHFSTQTRQPLRAQKYSLNEMKNLNRLLELIHSNQGWKSKRDINYKPKGRIRCLMAIFQFQCNRY